MSIKDMLENLRLDWQEEKDQHNRRIFTTRFTTDVTTSDAPQGTFVIDIVGSFHPAYAIRLNGDRVRGNEQILTFENSYDAKKHAENLLAKDYENYGPATSHTPPEDTPRMGFT